MFIVVCGCVVVPDLLQGQLSYHLTLFSSDVGVQITHWVPGSLLSIDLFAEMNKVQCVLIEKMAHVAIIKVGFYLCHKNMSIEFAFQSSLPFKLFCRS